MASIASKETVDMSIVTAALLDQNFKLDLPTNVQNQSIAYQTALRFNTTTDHLFMPEGLEFMIIKMPSKISNAVESQDDKQDMSIINSIYIIYQRVVLSLLNLEMKQVKI